MEVEELGRNSNAEVVIELNAQSNHGKEIITTAKIISNNSNPTKKKALMVNAGSNVPTFYTEVNGIDHEIDMTSSSRDITNKVTGNLINLGELKTGHTLNANPTEVVFEWELTIQRNNLATHTQAHHMFTNGIKEQLLHPTVKIEEQPTLGHGNVSYAKLHLLCLKLILEQRERENLARAL